MTDRPAVIRATYATWKPIPSRKVLQLVFEIPIEQQQEALTVLGIPKIETAQWYAIAKLALPASAGGASQPSEQEAQRPNDLPIKSARKLTDYPRSQQAAIKLQDPEFIKWLSHTYPGNHNNLGSWNNVLKWALNIESKRDLNADTVAAARWDEMLASFDYRDRT